MADREENEYMQRLLGQLTDTLNNDIKPIVYEILYKHIQKDIYGVYTPAENGWVEYNPDTGRFRSHVTYKRRYVLLDPKNAYSETHYEINGDTITGKLFATIDAKVAPFPRKRSFKYTGHGAFLELLEIGRLGIFTRAKFGGGSFPRPAVSNAQKEVDNSPRIKAAINRFVRRSTRI